jgi:hypothetical protein
MREEIVNKPTIGLRRIKLSCAVLTGVFLRDHAAIKVTANPLPLDVLVVGATYSLSSGLIELTVASASWNGPTHCGEIPELTMVFEPADHA